jgi:hypothetical protein
VVLHPEGLLHWPGRLRAPYEPFDFPPGMRRAGLSLVYCASIPTPATPCAVPRPLGRSEDAKAYVTPPPPMVLASTRGAPGVLAQIGRTTLSLLELPEAIAPAHGGWVVVMEADAGSVHAACDLLRIPEGATLEGAGIIRALLLASTDAGPDAVPASWSSVPTAPFAAFEDTPPGTLPMQVATMTIEEASASTVAITLGDARAEVPRYWLARMLHRIALHDLRVGYAETYGGFFIDDRGDVVRMGVRANAGERASSDAGAGAVTVARGEALAVIEAMYRAVAPAGYRERLE